MWFYNILFGILAYLLMEWIAALSHKYLMHGLLKSWHVSHHMHDLKRPDKLVQNNGFEKNDLFFLIFALPAIVLMILGINLQNWIMLSISIGITFYGITYFLIHDVMYHKRIKMSFIQKKHGKYFEAVLRAHRGHHKPKNKTDFESYGLLIFPSKYLKDSK
ncbi:sterol desaturase family protein [Saccharicrinis aurantiacus]|uniref:sterol desaturase family protein n=1 Tax=Saccharicrinis aurantiacus TaxID=1849719 RepID=UPI00249370B7|nr:sterol desaturase family protein [Saccharicrinis aurantiacus]